MASFTDFYHLLIHLRKIEVGLEYAIVKLTPTNVHALDSIAKLSLLSIISWYDDMLNPDFWVKILDLDPVSSMLQLVARLGY